MPAPKFPDLGLDGGLGAPLGAARLATRRGGGGGGLRGTERQRSRVAEGTARERTSVGEGTGWQRNRVGEGDLQTWGKGVIIRLGGRAGPALEYLYKRKFFIYSWREAPLPTLHKKKLFMDSVWDAPSLA